MLISGVDACKAGWIAISRRPGSDELLSGVYRSISQLIHESPRHAVLAIDIPIGLTASGPRECETLARRMLGRPRASSVFPVPIRPALVAKNRQEAEAISRCVDGRGVGAQAFGLYSRIREVDEVVRCDFHARRYIHEVHPELSFMAWNKGHPISESKKSPRGIRMRTKLVQSYFGKGAFTSVRETYRSSAVADDDICDAFACLWTAERIHQKTAQVIPRPPPIDALGIRMGMWY